MSTSPLRDGLPPDPVMTFGDDSHADDLTDGDIGNETGGALRVEGAIS